MRYIRRAITVFNRSKNPWLQFWMSTDCWILRQSSVSGCVFIFGFAGKLIKFVWCSVKPDWKCPKRLVSFNGIKLITDQYHIDLKCEYLQFPPCEFRISCFPCFHVVVKAVEWIAISKDSAFPFAKRGESWERMTGTAGSAVPPLFLNEHLYLHQQLHLQHLHHG